MKSVTAVISTLFRCGIIGGLYGAVLGAIYVGLLAITVAIRTRETSDSITSLCVALPFGVILGFLSGFISGVLGGILGGPIGFGIGGLIGTAAATPLLFGQGGLPVVVAFGTIPSIWGAAFGLVLGLHLRRRVPVLPGAEWLAESIYSSPLDGWLGWRQGHLE
jgi:hypothetical protein